MIWRCTNPVVSAVVSAVMGALVLLALALSGGLPAAADNRQVQPFAPWQTSGEAGHPLVGKVWSRTAGGLVSAQQYGTDIAKARFVLLGEVHDNPDHHALQAWAIRMIAKLRGARIVEGAPQMDIVALEMLTADDTPALDRFYGRNAKVPRPRSADDFGRMLKWDQLGWPDYAIYKPIIEAALLSQLVIRAASPARAEGRKISGEGFAALGAGVAAGLGLDKPLAAPLEADLVAEIRDGHCGLLPEKSFAGMSRVQRLRDARMADVLLSVGEWKGAILIAGNGHVRRDRGVPWYMQARGIPPGEIVVVEHVEVQPGETDPARYVRRGPDGQAIADYLVFTPRAQRPDACEEMRRQMEAMRARKDKTQ